MNLRLYAAAAAILCGSLTAYADTFPTFNVNGFFQDGSSFRGTLVLDPRNDQVFYVHIRTGKIGGDFDNYYSIYDQTLPGGNFSIDVADYPGATARDFYLYLPVSTLAGYNGSALCSLTLKCGSIEYTSGLYVENGMNYAYPVESGSITPQASTTVTPEPSTLALLGTGLVGMVSTIRRRLASA